MLLLLLATIASANGTFAFSSHNGANRSELFESAQMGVSAINKVNGLFLFSFLLLC